MIEVEFAGGGFLQKLAATVAEELVEADLDFEGLIGVGFVQGLLLVFDEWDLLIRSFRAEDVAERDVLEAKVLSDVIVVGNVDSCGYPVCC